MTNELHAHVHIEYTRNDDRVETLRGFDPGKEEDRKLVHEMLDEYLDYLKERLNDFSKGKGQMTALNEYNGFEVRDFFND